MGLPGPKSRVRYLKYCLAASQAWNIDTIPFQVKHMSSGLPRRTSRRKIFRYRRCYYLDVCPQALVAFHRIPLPLSFKVQVCQRESRWLPSILAYGHRLTVGSSASLVAGQRRFSSGYITWLSDRLCVHSLAQILAIDLQLLMPGRCQPPGASSLDPEAP